MEVQTSSVPSHVRKELVRDVDLYNDPKFKIDMHATMAGLLDQYPGVFYSPHSGGYWVVNRSDLINTVMTDTEHFSSRQGLIPPVEPGLVMVPLSLDPPEHTPYRMALMKHFGPRNIATMQTKVRGLAAELIERVKDKGTFEFLDSIGATLPVTVFMELMGLPLERLQEFREIVLEFFDVIPEERRRELYAQIESEMLQLIEDRRENPRDDLMSHLQQDNFEGRRLTVDECRSMSVLLFVAGMDTVANAAAFMFYYLAKSPAIQAELAADPSKIPAFVEESLRMYPVVNTPRRVKKDVELGGAKMKTGDMIFVMLALAGRDDAVVPNPNKFEIDRATHPHMAFGGGPHVCAGQFLARLELRMLVEEWFKRIKSFELAPGYEPDFRAWQVMALSKLELKIKERR